MEKGKLEGKIQELKNQAEEFLFWPKDILYFIYLSYFEEAPSPKIYWDTRQNILLEENSIILTNFKNSIGSDVVAYETWFKLNSDFNFNCWSLFEYLNTCFRKVSKIKFKSDLGLFFISLGEEPKFKFESEGIFNFEFFVTFEKESET